ncbi:putative polyketide biosynthesis enoyl-CoA isomerase PksI [Enhygromyxa salina]|uniref:Putative polyketide biosynthesis enoyl-CoA isomerase PksI n=1 Tax=Enhygromyxa salina TaxID=215803 RepID=A0A2S9Y436_9BACT|nr:polyketide synthase [Enhygromyxa salina]PRP99867.1 putative polyketide biosynthesis enoyl-CoA isomerase PksI [Enhygromyxa salina]
MTDDPRVRLTIEDGVAELWMCDEAGNNSFSRVFVDELLARLAELSRDGEAKVCVVRGLPELFSAGGDQGVLLDLAEGRIAPYDLELTRNLIELPIPTIAAIEGHAVGGGLIFGLACDMVVLARESRYGTNFMDLGFTPGMGTTGLLQFAVGHYLASEMMYGCQYFKGSHFEQRGNINYVVERAKVLARARKLAARFTDKPRFAIELLKRQLALPRRLAFEQARTVESMMHQVCFGSPETSARIRENYNPGRGGSNTD